MWKGEGTDTGVCRRWGLIRGRDMNDAHRLVWLLGMPAYFIVNLSQQTFTGEQYQSIEQYRDMGKTGRTRGIKDTYKLLDAQWTPLQLTHRCMVCWMVWQLTRVWMSIRHCRLYDWNVRQSYLFGSKTAITIKDQQVQVENDRVSLPIMKTIQATLSNMSCTFIRKMCLTPRSCKW